jgi:hypothetical protein
LVGWNWPAYAEIGQHGGHQVDTNKFNGKGRLHDDPGTH